MTTSHSTAQESPRDLSKFAWFSVGAAISTIALKYIAYEVTGSVSLLSDAMESVVNLVAAIVALIALKLAAKPANSRYTFGRSKAEYFSAALEGAMIFGAAALIMFAAIGRLLRPVGVENLGIGIVISILAGLVNAGVGLVLLRAGKKYNSPTLTADAKHLFTDIITSVGVVIGVGLVGLTGWTRLDPVIAIIVALNIIYVGTVLMRTLWLASWTWLFQTKKTTSSSPCSVNMPKLRKSPSMVYKLAFQGTPATSSLMLLCQTTGP